MIRDESETAQNERAHNDLAQFCISRDEGGQTVRVKLKKLSRFQYPSEHQAALPGDHADFTGKWAGSVCGYQALTGQVRLHNSHGSGKQNKERNSSICRTEQDLARLDSAELTARTDAFDLRRGQV